MRGYEKAVNIRVKINVFHFAVLEQDFDIAAGNFVYTLDSRIGLVEYMVKALGIPLNQYFAHGIIGKIGGNVPSLDLIIVHNRVC